MNKAKINRLERLAGARQDRQLAAMTDGELNDLYNQIPATEQAILQALTDEQLQALVAGDQATMADYQRRLSDG